jgi:hypothetical protein
MTTPVRRAGSSSDVAIEHRQRDFVNRRHAGEMTTHIQNTAQAPADGDRHAANCQADRSDSAAESAW